MTIAVKNIYFKVDLLIISILIINMVLLKFKEKLCIITQAIEE
jgi:hypothetical protein